MVFRVYSRALCEYISLTPRHTSSAPGTLPRSAGKKWGREERRGGPSFIPQIVLEALWVPDSVLGSVGRGEQESVSHHSDSIKEGLE